MSQDRCDDAAALFLTEGVGMPAPMVEGMREGETWGWFAGLAHTLPYDIAVCGPGCVLPAGRLATITVPTLVAAGGTSPEWAQATGRAVAAAIPGCRHVTLDGHDHGVLRRPAGLRPVLTSFYA